VDGILRTFRVGRVSLGGRTPQAENGNREVKGAGDVELQTLSNKTTAKRCKIPRSSPSDHFEQDYTDIYTNRVSKRMTAPIALLRFPSRKPTSSLRETKIVKGMVTRLLRAALGLPLAAAATPEINKLPIWHAGWQRHYPCPPGLPAGLDKEFELASYPTSTTTLRRRRQPSAKTTINSPTLDDAAPTSLHPAATEDPLQNRTPRAESPQPSPEFRSFPTRRRSSSPAPSEHSTASNSESWSYSDSYTATLFGRCRRRSANPAAETTRPSEREADVLWRRYWD